MKNLLTFSLCFLFTACGSGSDKETPEAKLEKAGSLELPLNNRTSYKTPHLSYFVDSSESEKVPFLVFLENNIPAIHFFDLNSRQLSFSILLKEEGPESVGRPGGMKIVSMDSIIVVSTASRKVSMLDERGSIIYTCNLFKEGQIGGYHTGMPLSYTINPLNLYNGKLYLNVAPDRNTWKPEYYDAPIMMEFDPEDCTYKYFNHYPKAMRGKVWGSRGMTYATTRNKRDQLVSSFASDHTIQVMELSDNSITEYLVKSKYIDELEPLKNPGVSTDKEYVFTTPSYGAIVYDPYRSIFYRFARHGLPELEEDSEYNDQPFSIMILDENFKTLGETYFPGELYVPHQFFLTGDGLYLSTNNDKHPDLREDVLTFNLFTVKGLEGIR